MFKVNNEEHNISHFFLVFLFLALSMDLVDGTNTIIFKA